MLIFSKLIVGLECMGFGIVSSFKSQTTIFGLSSYNIPCCKHFKNLAYISSDYAVSLGYHIKTQKYIYYLSTEQAMWFSAGIVDTSDCRLREVPSN